MAEIPSMYVEQNEEYRREIIVQCCFNILIMLHIRMFGSWSSDFPKQPICIKMHQSGDLLNQGNHLIKLWRKLLLCTLVHINYRKFDVFFFKLSVEIQGVCSMVIVALHLHDDPSYLHMVSTLLTKISMYIYVLYHGPWDQSIYLCTCVHPMSAVIRIIYLSIYNQSDLSIIGGIWGEGGGGGDLLLLLFFWFLP